MKIDDGQDYEWEEDGVGDQSVGEHGVIDKDVEGETGWFVVLLLTYNWLLTMIRVFSLFQKIHTYTFTS